VELIALGAMILEPKWIDRWQIKPTDFDNALNRAAFEIVADHHAAGTAITPRVLETYFDGDEPVDDERTVKDQIRIAVTLGNREATPGIGERLREQAARRAMDAVADQLRRGTVAGESPESLMMGVHNDLEAIVERAGPDRHAQQIGSVGAEIYEDLRHGVVPETIWTGSHALNSRLGGYERGELIIMAGRPSMGKSMVSQSLGLQIARKGHGVMMFSLEMRAKELGYRALSDLSWHFDGPIPYRDIRARNLSENQIDRIGEAAAIYRELPYVVDDRAGLNIEEIHAGIIQQQKRMKSLDVVIVDHIGHIKPSDRYRGQKTQEVGEVTAGLLKLAKDLNVVVIGVCQLNRGPEGRDEKRPTMADLRNSGDIEQDANTVCFVYRDAYYLERQSCKDQQKETERQALLEATRNQVEILIGKNRNGPTDTVHLYCDPACNVVRDLAK